MQQQELDGRENINAAAGNDASQDASVNSQEQAEPLASAQTEQSVESSAGEMQALMEDALGAPHIRRGETIRGVVVSKSDGEILIDVGAKSEGVVSGRELERLGPAAIASIKVGDEVFAYVLRPEDGEGRVLLSLSRAMMERDWRRVEQLADSGEVIERPVAGCNKGGVIVRLGRVRGFVPASQLSREHRNPPSGKAIVAPVAEPEPEQDLIPAEETVGSEETTEEGDQRWMHLVGEKLLLKVVEVDRKRNRLILSERAAGREKRRRRKDELIEELNPGDVLEGKVSSLCDFGAFIDLGGADGLVHLSELAWQHVKHPGEVLHIGQQVKVQVLSVDQDRKRVGLSIKRLLPEPWETVGERYSVGQLVDGTITKITDFGAFAQLEDGIEGLIHVSELANRRIRHPSDVVKEGDKVALRIIRIEPDKRRIGLSLKRVTDPEYVDMDWQFAEELDDWGVDLEKK